VVEVAILLPTHKQEGSAAWTPKEVMQIAQAALKAATDES